MKLLFKLLLISVSILILSQCNKGLLERESLFDIKNLEINPTEAEKQNFERIEGIDVLAYKKQMSDTLIQLDFDDNTKKIRNKTWRIKLPKGDKKFVKNFVQKFGFLLLGPIANYDNSKDYFFSVVRSSDNSVYTCKVINDNGDFFIYITYYRLVC
jgi:hypothetical protein